ncbi:hypothetical protein IWQ61_007281 [Dispira simplex]|nr:hypothetical protein IWQ61_007281 [Dispira simplex]
MYFPGVNGSDTPHSTGSDRYSALRWVPPRKFGLVRPYGYQKAESNGPNAPPGNESRDSRADFFKTLAAAPKEPSFMEKTKKLFRFYWNGIKQIQRNRVTAKQLTQKMNRGEALSRSEFLLIHRASSDVKKVIPFVVVAIILPELLPFLLVFAPGMFPSTCVTEEQLVKKRKSAKETRQVIHDAVVKASGENSGFVNLPNIIRLADTYQWDLDIHNLDKPALKNFGRFLGIGSVGMKHRLRDKLARHLDFLREDDKMIRKEGVETLSAPELHEACEARGM